MTGILASYWTVAGPVDVHVGREWSLFDFAERCAAAERAGFCGMGIWHADLEHVLERRTLADMKRSLDDHGLEYVELEFIMDWFLDPGDERRAASDATRDLLFEAIANLVDNAVKFTPQGSVRLSLDRADGLLTLAVADTGIGISPEQRDALTSVTDRPGYFSRQEILDRYAPRSGRDLANIRYYEIFAVFKIAVVIQQIYYRYAQGQTTDPRFATFDARVAYLARHAAHLAENPT